MKTIHNWFDEYAQSHQNRTNKAIHFVCVPVIFFCVLGLLAAIPVGGLPLLFPSFLQPYIHIGLLLVLFGIIFYLRLSVMIAIGILLFTALCMWGVSALAQMGLLWQVSLSAFVLAWIGQFVGHHIEGKKPSFLKDLQFLLIGPAWILGFIYRRMNIKY